MGNITSGGDVIVTVQTGDRRCAETNATVWLVVKDENGNTSDEIKLNQIFENNFERGKRDVFELARRKFADIDSPLDRIEIWRDYPGLTSAWFLDTITIEDPDVDAVYTYPVFRWIRPNYRYVFRQFDTCLPQFDPFCEQREMELEESQKFYKPSSADPSFPAQVTEVPIDEMFPEDFTRINVVDLVKNLAGQLKDDTWISLQDIRDIYATEEFYVPKCQHYWQEDWFFGYQRLNGANPCLIKLCTAIPGKFCVSDSMIKPFLEGMSVRNALKSKKLYMCDLGIFKDFICPREDTVICAPMGLFYLNKRNVLVPVAIQLYQESGDSNPVFLPSDDPVTWQLAKMWYNNADANYHMALSYIGYTCLQMEGIALSLHRHLSISHPIYKILVPYFHNLIASNNDIVENLLCEGGIMDEIMAIGAKGAKNIIKLGADSWKLNVHGCLPEDLIKRGVFDVRTLPGYHYRDDGMLLHYAIKNYVIKYTALYYDEPVSVERDTELQSWMKEMSTSREEGGLGIEGLPGEGSIFKPEQLQDLMTSIIFTCTVQQAALGGAQFDSYGFPPNYPLRLAGKPPADKKQRDECEILQALQEETNWAEGVGLARVFSDPVNKGILGDKDMALLFDPRAVDVHQRFKAELDEIGKVILSRNAARDHSYHYLIPAVM